MKILGNRLLLERIEEKETEGFQTVDVLDEFVSMGRIAQVGQPISRGYAHSTFTMANTVEAEDDFKEGNVVLFAKFSPETQEVTVDGADMKVVAFEDVIAVL